MRRNAWFRSVTLAAVLAAGSFAQDTQPPQNPQAPQGPPEAGRGVARISLVNGEVSVRRGESGDWVAAVANAPVSVDDHIATAAAARAEVQFDNANFLRLGANSEAQFAQLEQNRYQIQVARGTADFSVLRQTSADIEVDTPSVSVRPRDRGNYRITVLDDGQSEITVRAGQVEVYTPRGVETVTAGKTMMVRGDPSNPEYQIVAAIGPDDWDRWNADRDRRLETAGNNVYNRYVSPDVYGSESLEGYGRWVNTPDYGNVWTPQVARRLGALSRRPLGLGRLLRLDLGELRSVGLGSLSLRPLVLQRGLRRMVLVAGIDPCARPTGLRRMSGSSDLAPVDSVWASDSAM